MKKLSLIIMLFIAMFYLNPASCLAMHIVSAREIAEFNTSGLWSDVTSTRTTGQWNEYIRFTFYIPNDYTGKVRGNLLVSGSSSNINFNFLPGGIIKIFEFKAADPDMVFWILKDNSDNNDGLTHDFYLIGPYKGQYTTYVSMDNIVSMGWNSVNMKIRQLSTDEAWPVLQGFSDNGGGLTLAENLVLSWDESAGWFKMTNYPLNAPVQSPISD